MKKIIYLGSILGISALLSGCLGIGDGNGNSAGGATHLYANEDIAITIPNDWEILSSSNFDNRISNRAIVAFRNNVRNVRYTANVVIIKNPLPEDVATLDYAKRLYTQTTNDLTAEREIEVVKENINIGGAAQETLFVHLEGKESEGADTRIFMQKSGVKGKTAYIAVGSFLPDESEGIADRVKAMVKSFEVK